MMVRKGDKRRFEGDRFIEDLPAASSQFPIAELLAQLFMNGCHIFQSFQPLEVVAGTSKRCVHQ